MSKTGFNLSYVAEEDATIALVREVCIEETAANGFAFWRDNYVVLWAKFTQRAGIVRKSYVYKRGEGPGYVND